MSKPASRPGSRPPSRGQSQRSMASARSGSGSQRGPSRTKSAHGSSRKGSSEKGTSRSKPPSSSVPERRVSMPQEKPKPTGSEAVIMGRGARQFFIATNHIRQRQALYDGCNEQVGSLYGINEDYFDPLTNIEKKMHTRIEVPVIEKVTGVLCGGIKLCGPKCLPPCPPDTLGRPLVDDWFKTECCLRDRPLESSSCTDTDTFSKGAKSKKGRRDDDTMSFKSMKSSKSRSGKSNKTTKSKKLRATPSEQMSSLNAFDDQTKSLKLKKNRN